MKTKNFVQDKMGKYLTLDPVSSDDIISFARDLIVPGFCNNNFITSPTDCVEFLKLALSDKSREQFGVIFLTNRMQVISFEILFEGTLNGATVHSRIIMKKVLENNAASVIIAHNHPSGNPEPSASDKAITDRIQEALSLIDVKVLDHIVVGNDSFCSMSDLGLI